MTFNDIFKESWLSISGNKIRSFLTVLGIVIGVMAVVIMVAVGETVQKQITDQFSSLGTGTIIIRAGAAQTGGVRSGNRQTLTIDDAEYIAKLPDVAAVSAVDAAYNALAVDCIAIFVFKIPGSTKRHLSKLTICSIDFVSANGCCVSCLNLSVVLDLLLNVADVCTIIRYPNVLIDVCSRSSQSVVACVVFCPRSTPSPAKSSSLRSTETITSPSSPAENCVKTSPIFLLTFIKKSRAGKLSE